MTLDKRIWRVLRGLGQTVSDRYRSRGGKQPGERDPDWAEKEARAEMEMQNPRLPSLPDWAQVPEAPSIDTTYPSDTHPLGEPDERTPPSPQLESPVRPGDLLGAYYAVLGLPSGATIEQVEHAYRRLKQQSDPEKAVNDPLQLARARKQDALLDEAYLALRQALVRERRL